MFGDRKQTWAAPAREGKKPRAMLVMALALWAPLCTALVICLVLAFR